MLRIKDSRRLPGGVYFELLPDPTDTETLDADSDDDDDEDDSSDADSDISTPDSSRPVRLARTSYINLRSTPLSIRQIFAQYFQLGSHIQKHYLSAKVISRLLTGRFVPPLGRREMYGMQYSALPRERVSVAELWRDLFHSGGGDGGADGEKKTGRARVDGVNSTVGRGLNGIEEWELEWEWDMEREKEREKDGVGAGVGVGLGSRTASRRGR